MFINLRVHNVHIMPLIKSVRTHRQKLFIFHMGHISLLLEFRSRQICEGKCFQVHGVWCIEWSNWTLFWTEMKQVWLFRSTSLGGTEEDRWGMANDESKGQKSGTLLAKSRSFWYTWGTGCWALTIGIWIESTHTSQMKMITDCPNPVVVYWTVQTQYSIVTTQ